MLIFFWDRKHRTDLKIAPGNCKSNISVQNVLKGHTTSVWLALTAVWRRRGRLLCPGTTRCALLRKSERKEFILMVRMLFSSFTGADPTSHVQLVFKSTSLNVETEHKVGSDWFIRHPRCERCPCCHPYTRAKVKFISLLHRLVSKMSALLSHPVSLLLFYTWKVSAFQAFSSWAFPTIYQIRVWSASLPVCYHLCTILTVTGYVVRPL